MPKRKIRQPTAPPIRARRSTPAKQVAPAAPAQTQIELRSTEGFFVPLVEEAALGELAYFWNYVVRNRQRYSEESHKALRKQSQQVFESLGVQEDALREFARRGLVEVRIPYVQEALGWEARIMPWESILSLATREWRKDQHLIVVRHLDFQGPPRPQATAGAPGSILFVPSAPTPITKVFSFENEYRLISAAVSAENGINRLNNPTRASLSNEILAKAPALIHLSGVDSHQAVTFVQGLESKADGFLLSDEAGQPDVVEAMPLSQTLTAQGGHFPELVAFNCYYSGARLACMTVAAGAHLAIGFQDIFNDTLAEQFFAEFYSRWQMAGWTDPLRAFANARLSINLSRPAQQNGDVVLWTGQSLIPAGVTSFYSWLKSRPSTPVPASSSGPPAVVVGPPTAPLPPVEIIVDPKVRSRLNYSLLHNNASLFTSFKIQKSRQDVTPEVEVRVDLYVGEAAFPYRAVYTLNELLTDYGEQIRVPLVAGLLRGRRESIQTSLLIEVKDARDGGRTHYLKTERVTLLPADEWTDEEAEWQWLPSFVLPRDSAIATILTHAERYLRALADDSGSGFDGYQRLLDNGSNPEVVDLQIRAIWAALLYETPLTYINPPPTYTQNSQRLRTPSMILEERRGTCIDLALLFAACLEYVGILPVIFLIQGHSFPGYWRRPADQANLGTFRNVNLPSSPASEPQPSVEPVSQTKPWLFVGEQAFQEIANAVNAGGLVPIETVQLTQRGAFSHALELGIKNLTTPWSFDALIDIQIARNGGVTPLPLFENQP